ncbi:hypothetical protein CN433_23650 [Bacillus cereus]|nr:hypothetical protein [Bacillus thuringiensis]PES06353.1 hypothetical protein CN480_05250 [Bacillus cereus]PEV83212.1 hypothetical protein CN433_23650 [Bacillus cereus]PGX13713.1 hypothetical protein COE00_04705 [Bacillus cereus]
MVQEKLQREDSIETEKCKLLFGLFLLWELIPFSWYDLCIRGGSKNISAIIRIYRPQFKIYQRLLEYIDLPTKTDNDSNLIIKRGCAKILAHPLLYND